jgi:predicted PhzF superfamily epimerase YddE/YHI9
MCTIYPSMASTTALIATAFTEQPFCKNTAGVFVAKSTNVTITVAAMAAACNVAVGAFTQAKWLQCYTANTAKAFACGKFTCP